MKSKLPAQEEPKAQEEIVLSKSTFDSSSPGSLSHRLWWLKYELPSSLSLKQILPMVLPLLCLCPFMVFPTIFSGPPTFADLFHPDFLLTVSLIYLICCLLPMALVCSVSVLYLINPKEFLNLWQLPDLIRIRSDILELLWTKTPVQSTGMSLSILLGKLTGKQPRIRIPWQWIDSVHLRDYLYMGILPQKVLEIHLKEIPASYAEWQLLERVGRDGAYYFDPATQKLARKFALGGIRLPLPLFAFSSDVNLLLENIKRKCGDEVMGDVSLDEDNSNQIDSYTCLWLEELNSKGTHDSQRQLPIDSTLQNGAFKITSVLGAGGLSVVYLADEIQTNDPGDAASNQVAIKEILCNFSGTKKSIENNLKQILSEVSMLRMLKHPNIVSYKTSFAEGSRLYIVMDLVRGCNLRQFAQNNPPLNEQELLSFARQCCSILDYLHCQSPPILHRDFTPDNLMVGDGVLKLVDFNISQAAVTNSSQTVMGKHCFMAPEQFCGEASVASDLYQLGTTLFFIATATDPEPLTSCDLQLLRPELSKEFHQLVQKLTEREPIKRFASAKDVVKEIDSFANPGAHLSEAG